MSMRSRLGGLIGMLGMTGIKSSPMQAINSRMEKVSNNADLLEKKLVTGRRAQRWFTRGKNVLSNSRQSRRARLWAEAVTAVNEANLSVVKRKFYWLSTKLFFSRHLVAPHKWDMRKMQVGMSRKERRKLAKAYFAGEWKIQSAA